MRHWSMLVIVGIAAAQQAPTGNVAGQIVDAYFGEGQKGSIEIGNRRIETDQTGHFRIESIPSGSHTLVAHVPGFKSMTLLIPVRSGATLELPPLPIQVADICGRPRLAEIRYLKNPDAGAVMGTVRVGSADVVLKKGAVVIAVTRTDREGEFRFEPLQPGDYEVDVRSVGMYDEVVTGLFVRRGYESSYVFPLQACPDGNCSIPRPRLPQICE